MSQTEKIVRTCANCACSLIVNNVQNPLESQMFCRRDPATAAQMRGEKPRMRDGKAVMDRQGKPIMENSIEVAYLYKPTMPELVCFDGWRPEGTEPGKESAIDWLDMMKSGYQQLAADIERQAQESALANVDLGDQKN